MKGRTLAARVLVPVLAAVAAGCATLSEEECALSDWHTIGFEDGSRGYPPERLGDHRKACARHGYVPDFIAYQAGREAGLAHFCQPARGFNLGSAGGQYHGVCPPDLEPGFLDAYRAGTELFRLRANVSSVNARLQQQQDELAQTREAIREKQALLVARDTPAEERVLLLADLEELAEQAGRLEAGIELLIDQRARHEEQLAAYEASLAGYGY
ncbi:MAG TPA: DUF2799 domain-containing protein [Woeseiaceae bacterium]|nr:DUF2799 domain-containing protein [Woeseiaceae bacterium]